MLMRPIPRSDLLWLLVLGLAVALLGLRFLD